MAHGAQYNVGGGCGGWWVVEHYGASCVCFGFSGCLRLTGCTPENDRNNILNLVQERPSTFSGPPEILIREPENYPSDAKSSTIYCASCFRVHPKIFGYPKIIENNTLNLVRKRPSTCSGPPEIVIREPENDPIDAKSSTIYCASCFRAHPRIVRAAWK